MSARLPVKRSAWLTRYLQRRERRRRLGWRGDVIFGALEDVAARAKRIGFSGIDAVTVVAAAEAGIANGSQQIPAPPQTEGQSDRAQRPDSSPQEGGSC